MTSGIRTIVYPVKDLAKAKPVYGTLLGVEPYADQPYYVGFRVGDLEVGLDPHGHGKGGSGATAYFQVDDIKESLRQLLDAGAEMEQEINDFGGAGKTIASVRDADGNVVGLVQYA